MPPRTSSRGRFFNKLLEALRYDGLEGDAERRDARSVAHTPLGRRKEVEQLEGAQNGVGRPGRLRVS